MTDRGGTLRAALAARLVEGGLERRRRFSGEETARQTLAVYEAVGED